ncbi:acyl-CoA-like ligand-binding transcription factor [Actinokineospora bangkokensis]|uniref:HTH tetR-type domain-containing protein n=1 Tax=Actinokineospora bangkokensis TaxID=1193682 RepID=A0A1Q9LP06_9PSEU|nr:TetR family transcriptional regulator [Actinokineospora bangkokensis]OLR93745.1 hypothetical protein BJP25_15960 [Actinokineospora bangkokensis]
MAAPSTGGLRDRKKRETRTALSDAALDLVAERGIDQVTVDDIAHAAGVSPRTFFNYFPTKEDAVVGPDPDVTGRIDAHFAARPADEHPLAAVRAFLHAELAGDRQDRQRWLTRIQVIQDNPQLLNRVFLAGASTERALAAGVAAHTGLPVDHGYPLLVAATASAAFRVAITRWSTPGTPPALVDLVDEAFDLIARGLPAPTAP